MRINTSLKKMSRKQIKQICRIVIRWCVDHLGENHRIKKDLKIETVYNTPIFDGFAEYDIDEDNCIIRIYMDFNPTIRHVILACLHEYRHYLQPTTTKYDKLYKKYFYKNHPFEKEARQTEEKFYQVCWEDIKPIVEKLFDK